MRHIFVPSLLVLLSASTASAQVLITEIQPNPPGGADTGEWVEIHNTSTVAVSIEMWTLNDYTGTAPGDESTTKWAFPALTALQPGQVIIVARNAMAFMANTTLRPDYELVEAGSMDDAMVPNLVATGGTSAMALVNNPNGDAVVLRDAMGTLIDGVEYGTIDRTVPGLPQAQVPNEMMATQSLIRVANTGSSIVDFRVAPPTPGVGFTAIAGPVITEITTTPPHLKFGTDDVTFNTTVMDPGGVADVEIYLATATSSTGDSQMDYVSVGMTATTAMAYTYEAPLNNLAPGVAPTNPANFHSLYVRYYVSASNNLGQISTEPAGAVETQDNTEFTQKNVMPMAPSTIQEAREQDMNGKLVWTGHSVTVRGTVLSKNGVLAGSGFNVAIEDESTWAIRLFSSDDVNVELDVGDVVEATGSIEQFNGLAEVAGVLSVTEIGGMGEVRTTTLTIAQLLADAERYESRLVSIEGVDFVDDTTASWPGMGSGGNIAITDGTGQIDVRITRNNELFGAPAPQHGFDIIGIVGQFTSSPEGTTGGYQLFPRRAADLNVYPPPPPPDAGFPDTGMGGGNDAGGRTDAGTGGTDAGGGTGGPSEDSGCGCSTTNNAEGALALFVFALVGLFAIRRRKE